MLWIRLLQPMTLIAIITMTTGCQTTVGNYLGNRRLDLADCITLEAGVGLGLGPELKLAGLVHVAAGGCFYGAPYAGLRYGDLVPSSESKDQLTMFIGPVAGLGLEAWAKPYLHSSMDAKREHGCYWLLPALASYRDLTHNSWIWTDPEGGWSRLHAFDIQAHLFLGKVGVRAGFSPGEFVDFFLGWFGVDIAGDDVPLQAWVSPVEVE
ncbi:MAG: hypothetical protein O7H41_20205 [Planctomycetota bacterium]|nr:hypothetical protein [Planctomycetota bacterium]